MLWIQPRVRSACGIPVMNKRPSWSCRGDLDPSSLARPASRRGHIDDLTVVKGGAYGVIPASTGSSPHVTPRPSVCHADRQWTHPADRSALAISQPRRLAATCPPGRPLRPLALWRSRRRNLDHRLLALPGGHAGASLISSLIRSRPATSGAYLWGRLGACRTRGRPVRIPLLRIGKRVE